MDPTKFVGPREKILLPIVVLTGAFLTGGLALDDFDIAGFCGCAVSEMRGRCKRIIVRCTAAKKEPLE